MNKTMVILFLICFSFPLTAQDQEIDKERIAVRIACGDAMRNLLERIVGITISGSSGKDEAKYYSENLTVMMEGVETRVVENNSKYIVAEAFINRTKYLKNIDILSNFPHYKYLVELTNYLPDPIQAYGYGPLSDEGLKILKGRRVAQIDAMRKIASYLIGEIVSKNEVIYKFILQRQEIKSKLENFQYLSGLDTVEKNIKGKIITVKVKMNVKFYKIFLKLVLSDYKDSSYLQKFISEIQDHDIVMIGSGLID